MTLGGSIPITLSNTNRRRQMSPKEWSAKRERQYKHIKESELEQGRSKDRAEEIAAATVNKARKKKGETKSS